MRLIDYFDRGAHRVANGLLAAAPKSVDFIAVLPPSPVGKVLKRTLREPYWAGRKRKI